METNFFLTPAPTSLGIPMLPCALVNFLAARQPGNHGQKFRMKLGTNHRAGRDEQDDDAYYATDGSNMAAAEAKPPFDEALDRVLNSL